MHSDDRVDQFPPRRLETDRLLLRPPEMRDAQDLYGAYAGNPKATHFMSIEPYRNVAEMRRFLEEVAIPAWERIGHRGWTIEKKADGTAIGMFRFLRRSETCLDVGFVLGQDAWGQGYMTEVLSTVIDRSLDDDPIFRVEAICHVDDTISQRVMEKSGMLREGRLHKFRVYPAFGGVPQDCYLYAKVKINDDDI
ncbi:GNAT family N-acetyltransferase [bacterium]|nr:GNAT family N-acetyltransferase [bacterium]MCB9477052.1 GNAT family N-acetyltransferase [Deltaproteobacteria bacterium]MCB9479674.1 GNAT family N-acetyltransferase [Deltaproteobacteria bacterium]